MKITIINTGGTFNKEYNLLKGSLDVKDDATSLEKILKWTHNIDFEIKNILAMDSLDIKDMHREEMLMSINKTENENIILIHGTDTMSETAKYLDARIKNKKIIITGAMIPMSIDVNEAVMNFSASFGFLNGNVQNGVYISIHGLVDHHKKIYKNKEQGKFLPR